MDAMRKQRIRLQVAEFRRLPCFPSHRNIIAMSLQGDDFWMEEAVSCILRDNMQGSLVDLKYFL